MPTTTSVVRVFPKEDIPEEALEFRNITRISFIDNESHGLATSFGLTSDFKGRALLISSPNVTAVEVIRD